jgi:biopolymer transport protein ExbD
MAMNFHHRRNEEPEINLIPFIDVLLVVLIFLMLTTTYSKFTELKITLPAAEASKQETVPGEIIIAVSADGRYSLNRQLVEGEGVEALVTALAGAAKGQLDRPLIISADALATHQSVINVMDAARRVGLARLTFATQTGRAGGNTSR